MDLAACADTALAIRIVLRVPGDRRALHGNSQYPTVTACCRGPLMRLALLVVALVLPVVVHAAATAPMLVLSVASGEGTQGAHTVRLEGAFEFDNAVQVGYPPEVVVFQ